MKEWMVWVALAAVSLLGIWWVSDRAFARGVHSRDLEVSSLNTQIAGAAVALNQCNDASQHNIETAQAQRAMADAALNAAIDRDKNRTKELATAVDRLSAARATSDCKAAAETKLCSAMASY